MSAPVRYVVRRQEYAPPVAGIRRVLPEKWAVVAAFPRLADAEAEYTKRLADFRRTQNPFQLGGPNLFYQTSLPPYALYDYLLDHAITPPPTAASSNPNYVFWWVKHNRTFADEERAAVWQACDKLKPFEVAQEDDRQAVWLVVENEWLDQHSTATSGEEQRYRVQIAERFEVREAHRTRREADRAKEALAGEFRAESEDDGLLYFSADGQNHDWAAAPFFSAHKVPARGTEVADTAFIITRGRYAEEPTALPRQEVWEQLGYGNEREPLFVVGDGETAEQHVTDLRRWARRTVNPFAVNGVPLSRRPLTQHVLSDEEGDTDELPNGLTLEDAFAAVHRLDTTPPPPADDLLLADWYDQVVRWSPEFIDVIWGTFADFRLFEVIEVPLG